MVVAVAVQHDLEVVVGNNLHYRMEIDHTDLDNGVAAVVVVVVVGGHLERYPEFVAWDTDHSSREFDRIHLDTKIVVAVSTGDMVVVVDIGYELVVVEHMNLDERFEIVAQVRSVG